MNFEIRKKWIELYDMPLESDSQIIPRAQPSPVLWTRRKIIKAVTGTLVGSSGGLLWGTHSSAQDIHFHDEKIPLDLPRELTGMRILVLTDPHIGGNIDVLAGDVGLKTRSLLDGDNPQNTIILHGGDFVSRSPAETSLKTLYKTSPLLFGPLAGYNHQFGVRGNHDIDHSKFSDIIDHFSREHNIDFLASPYQKRTLKIGNAEVAVFGLDTGAAILHNMNPSTRDTLLDAYIEKLNSGKQCNILLMHNPDGFEFLLKRLKETQTNIATPTIVLAGHTHGGMINFPGLVQFALNRINVLFGRYNGWYRPEGEYAETGKLVLRVVNGMGNSPHHDYRFRATPEVVRCVV